MFHLRKWYLDAVSPEGRLAIAYAAWLRMGPFRWTYSAVLLRDERFPSNAPETRAKFAEASEPEVSAHEVRWNSRSLAISGTWHAIQQGPRLTLHPGVVWNVLMPSASVRIETRGESWEGRGYVECIEMHLPPWRLPIDELRWGRWIGEQSSLVWIEWKGSQTRRWMLRDAAPVHAFSLDDFAIRTSSDDLVLAPIATLREGQLGTSVLAAAPCLRRLSPARMLQAHETKWLSQGILRNQSAALDRGWAIHEVVRFAGGHAT